MVRQTYEEMRAWPGPTRHSPCSSRQVLPPPAPARSQSPPRAPVCPPPQATRAGMGQAAPEPPLPQQKVLSEVPLQERGARWHFRQKPYAPWNPSQTQLWEACHLLTGEGEWSTPKCVFVPEGDPLCRGAKCSMRWVCGHGSCNKLVSSQLDGRGHYQPTHLSGQVTSPLCSCGLAFNSCTTLANHLDIQHNVHHAGVSRWEPTVYLIYLDRLAAPPTSLHSPTPFKCKRKQ